MNFALILFVLLVVTGGFHSSALAARSLVAESMRART